jgi:hypothetical protein
MCFPVRELRVNEHETKGETIVRVMIANEEISQSEAGWALKGRAGRHLE